MSEERWVFLNENGQLVLHIENDGWTFVRKGAEAHEKIVTLDYLKRCYPGLYEKALRLLGT